MLDSKITEIGGIAVHCWEGGKPDGFPLLMLHGVGPGTSIQGNFGPVLEPLAAHCRIVATDLVGFGQSGRKAEPPYFDPAVWLAQAETLLSRFPDGPCGIAGHSFGGALALKLAARLPRVTRVLTSSTVGTSYRLPEALEAFWAPQPDRATLRATMQRMVAAPEAVTDAMIDDRWKLLAGGDYAAYFGAMFAAPRQRYLDLGVVTDTELDALRVRSAGPVGAASGDPRSRLRVVMLHGRDDQPCPPNATTLALARHLPAADVHLLANCGHNLPRERTADYLAAATALFA